MTKREATRILYDYYTNDRDRVKMSNEELDLANEAHDVVGYVEAENIYNEVRGIDKDGNRTPQGASVLGSLKILK